MNQYNPNQGQQQYQQQNPPAAQAVAKREAVICITQGRILFTNQDGDLFKGGQKKNLKTGEMMFDPQSRLPIWEWVIGIAVPKTAIKGDPTGIGKIWTEMWTEFQRRFPSQWQQMIDPRTGFPDPKTFSMKCKDGDTALDQQGKPMNTREGYKGNYILTLSTRIQPQFFIPQGGQNVQVIEGIKVGDIVNVCVQVSSGDSGLYLNPKMIQLVEKGAAIVSGPNADDVFGQAQPQRSQYVQSVPDPLANPASAFGNQMPQQGVPQFQQQAPVQQQYQQPVPQAQPNYGALPEQYQQPVNQGGAVNIPHVGNGNVGQQPHSIQMNYQQQYQPQGGNFDPNAVGAGQVQQPVQYAGGNQMPQQGSALPAGPNQFPTNNGMPR